MHQEALVSFRSGILSIRAYYIYTLSKKLTPERKHNEWIHRMVNFLQVNKPMAFRIKVQQAMNLPERIVQVSTPFVLFVFIPSGAVLFVISYRYIATTTTLDVIDTCVCCHCKRECVQDLISIQTQYVSQFYEQNEMLSLIPWKSKPVCGQVKFWFWWIVRQTCRSTVSVNFLLWLRCIYFTIITIKTFSLPGAFELWSPSVSLWQIYIVKNDWLIFFTNPCPM